MSMSDHVRIVAIAHIALSALALFSLCFVFFFVPAAFAFADNEPGAAAIFFFVMIMIIGVIIVMALPGLIAGIGLLGFRSWARYLMFVVAAFELLNFPLGTVLGAYTFWVLLQDETKALMR